MLLLFSVALLSSRLIFVSSVVLALFLRFAVLRLIAILYIYATLGVKFFRFDSKQRDAVRRGLREGFAIKL